MATPEYQREEEKKKTAGILAGGSTAQAIAGLGAMALTILGLAEVLPVTFAAISTIAIGAGLFLQGGAVMARYRRVIESMGNREIDMSEIGSGVSVEFLGGLGGIALGILGLVRVEADILLPIAVIMFGAVLLIGAGLVSGLARARVAVSAEGTHVQHAAEEAIQAAAGMEVFVGIGAIALGILALVGVAPLTLTLVGLLASGTAIFFSGTSVGARMAGVFAH